MTDSRQTMRTDFRLTDWRARVETAAAATTNTRPFSETARYEASTWRTCAIGEARQKWPDLVVTAPTALGPWAPTDATLSRLGMDFCDAVVSHKPAAAAALLTQIEARLAEIEAEQDAATREHVENL